MAIPQSCRDVLVEKNLSTLEHNRSSRLYLLSMVNRSTYDRVKTSAAASWGPFSGSYENFRQHVENEKRFYNIQLSEDESVSALTLTGLDGAVDAWRQCMIANQAGLFCWLDGNPDGIVFTLKLQWAPPVGLGGVALTNVQESISAEGGGAKYEQNIPDTVAPGEMTFGIRRDSRNVAVRGHINARAGNGNYSTSFYIPATLPAGLTPDPYYISDHQSSLIRQGNILQGLQWNRVYWQPEVWIAGLRYEKALGMHPQDNSTAFAEFSIPSGARYFRTKLGLARQDSNPTSFGRVAGRVLIDGHQQWSATISGSNITQTQVIGIPQNARMLRLEVDSLGPHWSDHATWVDSYFSAL